MIYTKAKQSFLGGEIDLLNDTIKIILIDTTEYAVNLTTHQFLSDVPLAARISTTPALSGKSIGSGIFDAADTTFTLVSGPQCGAIMLYQDTGVEATSRLIDYQNSGLGLPITPNGADIDLVFDNGGSKIFALT
jgi:hypothetical protein